MSQLPKSRSKQLASLDGQLSPVEATNRTSPVRRSVFLLLLAFSSGWGLWAGKEFVAGPGEETVPDELIVRLRAGADLNSVLASLSFPVTGHRITAHANVHRLKLPPGLQKVLSHQLAA